MKNEKRDLKPFIRQWFKYLFLDAFFTIFGFAIVFAIFKFTPYFGFGAGVAQFVCEDIFLSLANKIDNSFLRVVGSIFSVFTAIVVLIFFYVLIPGTIILASFGHSIDMTSRRKDAWCALMYAHKENCGKEHKHRSSYDDQNDYQRQSYDARSEFEKMSDEKKMVEALRAFGFESENFTKTELTKQYRSLLKKFHPDANPGIDTTEATKSVQEKYEFLKKYAN